jgi:hypothetical protein
MYLLLFWLVRLTEDFLLSVRRQRTTEIRLNELEKEVRALRKQCPDKCS